MGGSKALSVSNKRIQRRRGRLIPVTEEEESLLVLFGHVRRQSGYFTEDDAHGLRICKISRLVKLNEIE
jgi:hypothetical protein